MLVSHHSTVIQFSACCFATCSVHGCNGYFGSMRHYLYRLGLNNILYQHCYPNVSTCNSDIAEDEMWVMVWICSSFRSRWRNVSCLVKQSFAFTTSTPCLVILTTLSLIYWFPGYICAKRWSCSLNCNILYIANNKRITISNFSNMTYRHIMPCICICSCCPK